MNIYNTAQIIKIFVKGSYKNQLKEIMKNMDKNY
jgi:hypothetical protein